jgi:ATP-binding cassette subfamily F protein 3
VAEAERLIVEVAGRTLIADAGFAVERGQRVALIGPNGSGKTTLLETLLGRRQAAAGRVKLGHNVTAGYYSQQSLELPEGLRTIDAVVAGTKLTGPQARTLLGRFLFSGEDVEKPVAALSGGERRRLALLRTVVSGANFLVLDEPTNHLDIESREALEDALLAFPGTLLFVSHDRALIEALSTRTLAIEAGRLTGREGGFGDYARAHASPQPAEPANAAKTAKPAKPKEAPERRSSQRAAKQAAKLERAIATLEEELGALETRLSQPDAYEDDALVAEDGTRHQEVQEELAYLYREWERHAAEAG